MEEQSVRTRQMLELPDREFNVTVINIYYNWVLQKEKNRSYTHSKIDGRGLLGELAMNMGAEKL